MNNNELTYNELQESDLIPHKWCSIDSSNIEDPEICFKLKVWKKQCEFGKQVLEFTRKMYYGIDSKKCLEDLIISKYSLQLLNSTNPKEFGNGSNIPDDDKQPVKITSFDILNQPYVVEVGTFLNGFRDFTWTMNQGDYVVNTVDILDVTNNSTIGNNLPNNGIANIVINNNLLNTNGQKQIWRMKANVVNSSDIYSGTVEVEAKYLGFFGPVSNLPANLLDGITNRSYALNLNSVFIEPGENNLSLATGTVESKFVFLVPDYLNVISIVDTINMGLDILNDYNINSIIIKDANGSDMNYTMYSLSLGGPYSLSTNHILKLV